MQVEINHQKGEKEISKFEPGDTYLLGGDIYLVTDGKQRSEDSGEMLVSVVNLRNGEISRIGSQYSRKPHPGKFISLGD